MKTITIRGIDSSVSSKLKQVAKEEKKSVNQLVLDMIKQHVGMQKKKNILKSMMTWIIFLGYGLMLNSIKFKVLLTPKEKWFKVVYKRHTF